MIESILVDYVKDIDISILRAFSDTYLKANYYINSRKLACSYMFEYYKHLNRLSKEYIDMRKCLIFRFVFIIRDYFKCGLIEHYTKHLYRKCECEVCEDLKGFEHRSKVN